MIAPFAGKVMAQEYCRSIARTAVAQLASHAGYERIQVGMKNKPNKLTRLSPGQHMPLG